MKNTRCVCEITVTLLFNFPLMLFHSEDVFFSNIDLSMLEGNYLTNTHVNVVQEIPVKNFV